jgi:nifR3 family TIM-barrel protein
MQIGNLILQNQLILAPMAGYTDLPFRLVVKEYGCGLVTSEMVCAAGLVRGNGWSGALLKPRPLEAPLSVQLFGADPLVMARAAAMVQKCGANIVDINMGCPVKKVVKTGAGAALLRDLDKIKCLLSEVRGAITCPLTIKIRAGWSSREIVASDVALLAQDLGVDAVAIHPRTARDGFAGRADWDLIKEVCRHISIPVIGNGDIRHARQAKDMIDYTGCSGVMIGRASLGNPWIFSQSLALLQNRKPSYPTLDERERAISRHFAIAKEYIPLPLVVAKMLVQTMLYVKGLPQCSAFRQRLQGVRSEHQFFETLERYFSFLKTSLESHES